MPRANFGHLEHLVNQVADVPGDFAEFGVWRGDTFLPMAVAAANAGRFIHAVDSFCGMAEPTERDQPIHEGQKQRFPKGGLNPGGTHQLYSCLGRRHIKNIKHVRIWEGFVPAVLDDLDMPRGLAFAHVDLDQYAPTLAAMSWAWERTNPGGILACHDYWPERDVGILATAGVDEFMSVTGAQPAGQADSGHIWFVRGQDVAKHGRA